MEKKENDIIYSKAIKAGKRIYYLDVKKSRNEDLYLSITESKKRMTGTEDPQVSYEKHKIFLYKEDFEQFSEGLEDVIGFIKRELGTPIIITMFGLMHLLKMLFNKPMWLLTNKNLIKMFF